jgi:multidrug efflux system membrane fusion protein
MRYYLSHLLSPALIAGLLACGAGCGGKGDAGGKGGAPGAAGKPGAPAAGGGGRKPLEFPVEVEAVSPRRVEYAVRAVGSIEAFEQVQVTARIAGAVDKLDFAEGDRVKAGQVLVEIEPRRFQIAVESAQAAVARTKAELAETQAALQRRQEANEKSPGLVKAEEIESMRARVAAQDAARAAAESQLHLAELNLRDAFVRAPIAGQIESRDVRTGQYVQPGTPVATLLRRDPLLVRFQVPELDAASLLREQKVRFSVRDEGQPLNAVITHVAQAADATSRMVMVTARVDDPRADELRPGAFAQVTVPIDAHDDAPVVVETAIRPSEKGFVAFVVTEGVAHERVLTLGLRTLDGKVEVKQGLEVGDLLVVRGAEALTDGAKVKLPGAGKPAGDAPEAGGAGGRPAEGGAAPAASSAAAGGGTKPGGP